MTIENPTGIENPTVDDLVNYCTTELNKGMYRDVYLHLIVYHSMALLKILKSGLNKPSEHDLSILSAITEMGNKPVISTYLHADVKQILEIYKNRKE